MVNSNILKNFSEEKKKENKQKFDLFDKIFKNTGNKKTRLIQKIEKFADKKASHFVNIKKIKKREPYSTDFLDNMQVRSLSRTFTGTHEIKNKFIVDLSPRIPKLKLQDSLSKIDENDFSLIQNNTSVLNGQDSPESFKNGELDFEEIMMKRTSVIGNFYENLPVRNSVFIKGKLF
jgi:hypothetical protein